MRLLYVLLAGLMVLSGCNVTVLVSQSTEVSRPTKHVFYNDTQKWHRAKNLIGRQETLSRGQVLRGSGQYSAAVIAKRLRKVDGYRGWVCRGRTQRDVLVVRCARHHKLQRYVSFNNMKAFNMGLQPLLKYSSAPLYVDWGW